jgi:hypothetical protein
LFVANGFWFVGFFAHIYVGCYGLGWFRFEISGIAA